MSHITSSSSALIIRYFEHNQDYSLVFQAMKDFTNQRNESTADEIWLMQHNSLYTQGQAGKPEHILMDTELPIVQSDRGGQVTWHGPGQLVAYFLLDLNRLGWNVRTLVSFAEQMMVDLLNLYHINAYAKKDAPGVYVDEQKIGSLGFKIRRGRSYHGFSLNIHCDLKAFDFINPCGFSELKMTKLHSLISSDHQPTINMLYHDIVRYLQCMPDFPSIRTVEHQQAGYFDATTSSAN